MNHSLLGVVFGEIRRERKLMLNRWLQGRVNVPISGGIVCQHCQATLVTQGEWVAPVNTAA
jgi:hypothetical protein